MHLKIFFLLISLLSLILLPSCRKLPAPTATLPIDWPDDVPIMGGFVLMEIDTEVDPEGGGDATIAEAVSFVSVESTEAFYKNLNGWNYSPFVGGSYSGERVVDDTHIEASVGNRLLVIYIDKRKDGFTHLVLWYYPEIRRF